MPGPDERRQMRVEAERAAASNSKLPERFRSDIPEGELIEHQRPELYRPRGHLNKTAFGRVEELEGLLRELWEVNEEWVGVKTWEVDAYLTVIGDDLGLKHRLSGWCDWYFGTRSEPLSRLNPRNNNDPFILAEQVVKEWKEVFGSLIALPRSVNQIFLGTVRDRVHWGLYDRLVRPFVVELGDGGFECPDEFDSNAARMFQQWAINEMWTERILERFLDRVGPATDPALLTTYSLRPNHELCDRVRAAAGDIQVARPYLVKNFDPLNTKIELGPACLAVWNWKFSDGIGSLVIGDSDSGLVNNLRKSWSDFGIRVGIDGLFFPVGMPWWTTEVCGKIGGVSPLALNCMILERFRDTLVSFFNRIDLDRWGRARSASTDESRVDGGGVGDAVAGACYTLAIAEPATAPGDDTAAQYRRLPQLRMQPFLRAMSRLGCEERPGKGSEVVLYRADSKARLFTIGRHTRNREVHSAQVREALKRLNLSEADFVAVARGKRAGAW